MDPNEVLAVAGSAWTAQKVLGPTLDYVGNRLLDTSKAIENIVRVVGRAAFKLGEERLSTSGGVAPAVARQLLEEAAWTSEEIRVEYISGVLASSRSENADDDRGLPYGALISRLPSDALRAHMVLYRAAFEACGDRWSGNTIVGEPLREMTAQTFEIPFFSLIEAVVGPQESELDATVREQWLRSMYVLERELLMGTATDLPLGRNESEKTYRYRLSTAGLELALWGAGLGRLPSPTAMSEFSALSWDESLPHVAPVPWSS